MMSPAEISLSHPGARHLFWPQPADVLAKQVDETTRIPISA